GGRRRAPRRTRRSPPPGHWGVMRNATIATSRTRATTDRLIDYRPLPAARGDRESLRALRTAKAQAGLGGEDPRTLQLPARTERPAARRRRRALLPLLHRVAGIQRRGRRDRGLLLA